MEIITVSSRLLLSYFSSETGTYSPVKHYKCSHDREGGANERREENERCLTYVRFHSAPRRLTDLWHQNSRQRSKTPAFELISRYFDVPQRSVCAAPYEVEHTLRALVCQLTFSPSRKGGVKRKARTFPIVLRLLNRILTRSLLT